MTLATLRARLAKAKSRAAEGSYTYVKADNMLRPSSDWREHARGRLRISPPGIWQRLDDMPRHASTSSRAYYCDNWPDGFRLVGSAYDVSRWEHSRRVDHTGWYTDSFQGETLSGHVLQLPGHDGRPVFVPGTAHSDWDGVTLYPLDMYDNALDCAQTADQYAEHGAEASREFYAKDQAEQQINDLREEIVTLRSDARALIRDMKAARRAGLLDYPAICAALRDKLADVREESHKAYRRIGKLTDNFWLATEYDA